MPAPLPAAESGSDVEQIGILGLGRMGLPIAKRLLAAGLPVTVYDPRDDRLAAAVREGARAATGPKDLGGRVDLLVTVLPGPGEVRDALLGDGGALGALRPGSCWVDLTSNDPRIASQVAKAAEDRGVASVGAPMGGGPSDAAAGTIRFYLGGDDGAVGRVTPVLGILGDPADFIRTGADVGSAFTTKLLANTLWFGQAIAVTEVLLLGQAAGLSVIGLRDALAVGPGGSAFISQHLDALLAGDYLTTFGIDRVVEELEAVTTLAGTAGTPSESMTLIARLHREALERFGDVDGELLGAKLLEERAGRTLSRSGEAPTGEA